MSENVNLAFGIKPSLYNSKYWTSLLSIWLPLYQITGVYPYVSDICWASVLLVVSKLIGSNFILVSSNCAIIGLLPSIGAVSSVDSCSMNSSSGFTTTVNSVSCKNWPLGSI